MNSDDERVCYLAGETVESLSDAERAQLDELRLEPIAGAILTELKSRLPLMASLPAAAAAA